MKKIAAYMIAIIVLFIFASFVLSSDKKQNSNTPINILGKKNAGEAEKILKDWLAPWKTIYPDISLNDFYKYGRNTVFDSQKIPNNQDTEIESLYDKYFRVYNASGRKSVEISGCAYLKREKGKIVLKWDCKDISHINLIDKDKKTISRIMGSGSTGNYDEVGWLGEKYVIAGRQFSFENDEEDTDVSMKQPRFDIYIVDKRQVISFSCYKPVSLKKWKKLKLPIYGEQFKAIEKEGVVLSDEYKRIFIHDGIFRSRTQLQNNKKSADLIEFENLYNQLQALKMLPENQIKSNPDYCLKSYYFKAIVKGGNRFIPYVVEKLKTRDYFMTYAMREITKISIFEYFIKVKKRKPDIMRDDEIEMWLTWWDENKSQYVNTTSK